jgi:hypothetical protein
MRWQWWYPSLNQHIFSLELPETFPQDIALFSLFILYEGADTLKETPNDLQLS